MIVFDLAPLAVDPQRGVARALRYLLQGLAALPRPPGGIVGLWPAAAPAPAAALAVSLGAALDDLVTYVPAVARVLLSPWTAFRVADVPVVAQVHELPFVRHGALEGFARSARHRLALAQAVERAAALVVPSRAVYEDLLELHPEAGERVTIIPHGFDPGPWARVRAEVALRPYALLLGSGRGAGGAAKKGVDLFLGALERLGPAVLDGVIVGEPVGSRGSVRCVEQPDDAEVRGLVAGARMLVMPSRSEGFGFPVLEAFAAGVPVLAAAAGALPEVSGGAALLVPPDDVGALAAAMAQLNMEEPLRASQVALGHERASAFPVTQMACAYLDLLARVGGIAWRA